MTSSKVADAIRAKKLAMKGELGTAYKTAFEEPAPTTASPYINFGAIPVLKNRITYKEIFGCEHPILGNPEYPAPPTYVNVGDIPTPDPHWCVDHRYTHEVCIALLYKHNAGITGKPGTGKTKIVRECCARIGIPYYRLNGTGTLEPSDIWGQVHIDKSGTKYVNGYGTIAVEHGGCLAFDEPFTCMPETISSFQALAEEGSKDRYVMRTGHQDETKCKLYAHPDFQLFLCSNVRGTGDGAGEYASTTVQDQSFLNRISRHIEMDYMTQDKEVDAIHAAYPWVSRDLASDMTQFASMMRTAWRHGTIEMPFSFRQLQSWSTAIAETRDVKIALDSVYGNTLNAIEREVYDKAYKDVGFKK